MLKKQQNCTIFNLFIMEHS